MFARRSNAIRLGPKCHFCGKAVASRSLFFCFECLPMVIDFADVVMSDALSRRGAQRLCSRCHAVLKARLVPKLVTSCIRLFRSDFAREEDEGRDTSSTTVPMSAIVSVMEILVEEGDTDEEVEKKIGRCRHLAMVGEERDNVTGRNASEKDGEQGEKKVLENVACKDGEEDEEVGENVLAKDGEGDREETASEASEEEGKESEKVTAGDVFAMDLEEDGEVNGEEALAMDEEVGKKEVENVADKNGDAREAEDGEEFENVIANNVSAMDGEENGEQEEEEVFARDEEEVVTEVVEDVFANSAEEVRGKAPTESAFAKDGGEGEKGNVDEVLAKDGEEVKEENGDKVPTKDGNDDEKANAENVAKDGGDGEENGDEVLAKDGGDGEKTTAENVVEDCGEGEEEITEYAPIKEGKEGEKGMGDYIFVKDENEAEGATGEHIFEDEEDDENMMGDYVLGKDMLRECWKATKDNVSFKNNCEMNPNAKENDGIYNE